MTGKPDDGRRVALGPALDTADEELDLAALVTPEDVEAARADPALPPRLKALLAAAAVGKARPTEGGG